MIDLTSDWNRVEDLFGEVGSKLVIFFDTYFCNFAEKYLSLLGESYIKAFMECLPSGVLLRQIFNEKVKVGNLVLDRSPLIVSLPSQEMRGFRDWEILLTRRAYVRTNSVLVTPEGIDACKARKIALPNPGLSFLGRSALGSLTKRCGDSESREVHPVLLHHREIPVLLKEGRVEGGVMWEHEAKLNGFNYMVLERNVVMEVALLKGADKVAMNAFELLFSQKMVETLESSGLSRAVS